MVSRIDRQTCHSVIQEEEDDESSYDRMNQMMSFLQKRMHPSGTEEEEAEVQEQVQEQEQVQVQEQVREHKDQKEEEMTEEEEEEEEEEENDDDYVNDEDDEEERSLISGQFQEASDYFDHASLQPSPSHFTTWSYQDNEVGDDSDRATSVSPRQQSPFRSYYPNSPQHSPSQSYNTNHPQRSPSLSHPSMVSFMNFILL
jgi:hypothetical protein